MKSPFPPKKVLVAVDGSQPSFDALKLAKTLASSFGSVLEAVYVEPVGLITELDPPPWVQERELRLLREEIVRRVSGAQVPLRVERGEASAELLRQATPRRAQLLVMGTHARQGSERFLMGSTAEAVMHRARIPVLAVRAGWEAAPKQVLVPCNLETYGDEALRYGLELAGKLDAGVTVLLVSASREWIVDADRRLYDHVENKFGTEAARRLTFRVRSGDAREEIAQEAQSGRYGLVVLSGHHRSQLSDLALGTTAERLLRRCPAPLLVVPDKRGKLSIRVLPA